MLSIVRWQAQHLVDAYFWTQSILPSTKIWLKRCVPNGMILRISESPKNPSICNRIWIGYLRMPCLLTCRWMQVNVAQAVYAMGSKMNHSCSPNVHASFQDRHLRVRTIVPVQASFPLELCYGAQVSNIQTRPKLLSEWELNWHLRIPTWNIQK
jgi:hypothetical protein